MTDIVKKVTEEEFDDEGNLTRRVITEYGPGAVKWKFPTGGVVGPNPNSQIVSYLKGQEPFTINNEYWDQGSFRGCWVGGTDRTRYGEVVD